MSDLLAPLVIGVAAILFVLVYRRRRILIAKTLAKFDVPPAIVCQAALPGAIKTVTECIKKTRTGGRAWSIRQENEKGMLIAVASFEEDFGPKVGRINRQIIFTASFQSTESGGTTVSWQYSVFSPFNRTACDDLIQETTQAIQTALALSA